MYYYKFNKLSLISRMLVNVKDIHYDIDMNYFNYVINKKNVNYVIIKVYLLFDGQLLNYEESL